MTKPSAVQVALAKRLKLPATASRDEICRVAFAKMAASMSSEYQRAREKMNLAQREYDEAARKYRARLIEDDEYLSARRAHKKAEEEFDRAYAAEEARGG